MKRDLHRPGLFHQAIHLPRSTDEALFKQKLHEWTDTIPGKELQRTCIHKWIDLAKWDDLEALLQREKRPCTGVSDSFGRTNWVTGALEHTADQVVAEINASSKDLSDEKVITAAVKAKLVSSAKEASSLAQ